MNQLKPFMYGPQQVRTVLIENEPWFVAKDICDVLELTNSRMAIERLDTDEKGVSSIDTLGGKQSLQVVNEYGLYSLILGSRKPEAKQFKRWITHEVIPSIRKHGAYMSPETIEKTLTSPDFIIQLATQLKDEQTARLSAEAKIAEQQQKLKEQETPIAIYNLAISAKNTMSMNEVAKALGTGRTRLFRILREENVIMKDKAIPYQRFIDAGYFTVCERPRPSGDEVVNDSVTRVYAKGFDYIARILKKRAERKSDGLGMNA
ncbi:hypothetical protein D3C73_470670 [compost metagenome]